MLNRSSRNKRVEEIKEKDESVKRLDIIRSLREEIENLKKDLNAIQLKMKMLKSMLIYFINSLSERSLMRAEILLIMKSNMILL